MKAEFVLRWTRLDMPNKALQGFHLRLIDAGVSARVANRAVQEFSDHIDDLAIESMNDGFDAEQAERRALAQLGDLAAIAKEMASRTELKVWVYRYPRLARLVLPILYFALLPTAPIFAGVAKAPVIVRWGTCAMLGAAITALMFLVLQLSIAVT